MICVWAMYNPGCWVSPQSGGMCEWEAAVLGLGLFGRAWQLPPLLRRIPRWALEVAVQPHTPWRTMHHQGTWQVRGKPHVPLPSTYHPAARGTPCSTRQRLPHCLHHLHSRPVHHAAAAPLHPCCKAMTPPT